MDVEKTRLDLVNEALGILTNLPVDTAFSDEMLTTVDHYVDMVLNELSADNIVSIADPDAIPSEFFISLAGILASRCGPRFGQGRDLEGEERMKRTLRSLQSAKPSYEVLKADYF